MVSAFIVNVSGLLLSWLCDLNKIWLQEEFFRGHLYVYIVVAVVAVFGEKHSI